MLTSGMFTQTRRASPPAKRIRTRTKTMADKTPNLAKRTWHAARWLALAVAVGLCIQFVLGTLLHGPAFDTSPRTFQLQFLSHLIVALLTLGCAACLFVVRRRSSRWPAVLFVLLLLQILFCATAWIASYGLPAWFIESVVAVPMTVVASGPMQIFARIATLTTTSLALALSIWLTLRFESRPQ